MIGAWQLPLLWGLPVWLCCQHGLYVWVRMPVADSFAHPACFVYTQCSAHRVETRFFQTSAVGAHFRRWCACFVSAHSWLSIVWTGWAVAKGRGVYKCERFQRHKFERGSCVTFLFLLLLSDATRVAHANRVVWMKKVYTHKVGSTHWVLKWTVVAVLWLPPFCTPCVELDVGLCMLFSWLHLF
jgi:hypothetical protein